MRVAGYLRITCIAVLLAVTGAASSTLVAQTPRRPVAPTATTALRGRVVAAQSGAALPYARLRASGAGRSIRSDAEGVFVIDVPSRGTLVISKAGYVSVERALPIDTNAEIPMIRAAAIAGRVVNEYGEPIVGTKVVALGPNARAASAPGAVTDDRGDYRIGGLTPGRYRVAAQTTGVESPRVQSVFANGVQLRVVGSFEETGYTTYFPDTIDPDAAAEIALDEGAERGGVDLHVPNVRSQREAALVNSALPLMVDQRRPDPNGATIRGTITDLQGRPLPFAQVSLDGANSSDGNGPGGAVHNVTISGERGGFEFAGLRPGFYTIRAAKVGYTQDVEQPSTIGVQQAGEVHTRDVALTPWGIVSGRLRDEWGDPVQGARISLLRSRYQRGRKRLVEAPVSPRITDDRGEFRLFAVPPGEYVVLASTVNGSAAALADYPSCYFPGTLSGADARPLSMDIGNEFAGIDFALIGTPTARVTGTTYDAEGQPTTQLRVSLISKLGVGTALNALIETDGTFTFDNVPPGEYVLKADSGRTNTFTEGEFAALPVSVGLNDVSGLRVQANAGSTITGHFVFDRVVRTNDPPPTATRITAVPEDYDMAPDLVASTSANAAGVFQLRGVSGRRRLEITRVPPRYAVKAVLVNGRDVTDEAVPFGRANQSVDDVEVVLTDRISQVTATVSSDRVRVGAGTHVVLFSTDRARWYGSSRHLLHQVTSDAGEAVFDGIPPGTYFAVALRTVPDGDDAWQDSAFLEAIQPAAIITSIAEGDAGAVALPLAGP